MYSHHANTEQGGHIHARLGQNRAPLVRAGLGQVPQGSAGDESSTALPGRAGLGQAKLGRAEHGSLWVTALRRCWGKGRPLGLGLVLGGRGWSGVGAGPGVPIQLGHMGGFNQSHIHYASGRLQPIKTFNLRTGLRTAV